jgi:hypothetical protein
VWTSTHYSTQYDKQFELKIKASAIFGWFVEFLLMTFLQGIQLFDGSMRTRYAPNVARFSTRTPDVAIPMTHCVEPGPGVSEPLSVWRILTIFAILSILAAMPNCKCG